MLNLKKLPELGRIAKAREIVTEMTGNAHFPDPNPALSDLEGQEQTTQDAYDASRNAGTEETAVFHNALDVLERMMLSQANYVEIEANENPEIGDEIILSAGMEFKDLGEININDFSVKNARVKGSVKARIRAQAARTVYLWKLRIKGTADWEWVKATVQSRYTFTGLVSGTTYEFLGGYQLIDNKEVYFDPIELNIL